MLGSLPGEVADSTDAGAPFRPSQDGGAAPRDARADQASRDGAGPRCEGRRAAAVPRPRNLLLLVDDSLGVVLQPLWTQLTQAIDAFVDDPAHAGLGVGITYFGASCDPASYADPDVAIAPLPGVAEAIKRSYPLPLDFAALAPALEGGIRHARSVETADPARDTDVLLISGGLQELFCSSTIENVRTRASSGFEGDPAVRTHVIGLGAGPTLVDPIDLVDLSALDEVAAAGGTRDAFQIRVDTGDATDQIGAALAAVAQADCAYRIPDEFPVTRTTLEWQPTPDVSPRVWPRVAERSACADTPAVFVDAHAPSYLALCPEACLQLRSNPAGVLSVREDCSDGS